MFRCTKAAYNIAKKYTYYMPAANRVRFRIDNDRSDTAYIDCRLVVSFNEKYLKKLTDTGLEGIILHEIMH
jgi:predicted SprT family Zn-dependent metalloprotease